MAHKNHYKKIFVIAAALFVLFAPVGMTLRGGANRSVTAPVLALAPSSYSAFRPSFNLNLAEASGTTPVTAGAGAGSQTNVQPVNFLSCTSQPVTCAVYYVALYANGAMGVLVSVGAFLVRLGLQFNDNIYNSPAVQTGFSVALAIANLGFVLGIIIIAIATIIRNQTYGMKQLLWKLVFMAILVNFGLVITAPIVGFASSMSNYFVNATSPGSMSIAGYEGYAQTMTSAFSPQDLQLGGTQNTASQSNTNTVAAANTGVQAGCGGILIPGVSTICSLFGKLVVATTASDNFWQMGMAMVFQLVFSALIVFTFLCLAVLLIVRYLMLAGLLIVLPLAWLTYVFPKFDNSFSKWWNTFIKWTFFPPLALFFIYLAFITATNTTNATGGGATSNSYEVTAAGLPANDTNGPEASLVYQTGLSGVIQQAADEVLLVGLTIMGLMFALSLSGKAGSTVVNGATAVTKAAAGYVGKKTGKGAARAYQKMGGGDLNKNLQQSRIPGFSAIGRGMANLTERATKNQVDAQHKALGLGTMDDDRLQAVTQGLHGKEAQLAAVQEWQKRGKLDKIEEIGGDNFQTWLKKNQGTFKDYSQGKLGGDIDKAMGSNDKIRRIANMTADARATVDTQEITNSLQVVDKEGIMGPKEAVVPAKDLARAAKEDPALERAQAVIDDQDSTKAEKKVARTQVKKFQDVARDADAAITDAINARVDNVDVEDKENLLGHGAGQKAKAGELRKLMETESEKFWEGKDKGDATKMKTDAIFGDKPKFGLTKEALDEIGRSVAHGIITQSPGAMGSLAGKTDNSQQLTKLTDAYIKGIREARKNNKISAEQAKKMDDAARKMLGSKLAFLGGGDEYTSATPATPPKP